MDSAFNTLEAEYCPPIDPALLSAILSDFDLTLDHGIQSARAVLDLIKESAPLEEAAGFDASGTGAYEEQHHEARASESSPGEGSSLSRETDQTSLSNGLSSVDLDSEPNGDALLAHGFEELDALDEDTKVQRLEEVLERHVSSAQARYILRKCNGRWSAAFEELLNHVYFDQAVDSEDGSKVLLKGVDAFFEPTARPRSRKGKKGKASRLVDDTRSQSVPASPTPPTNKWQASTDDIQFIASHTSMSAASVGSLYWDNGASLPKTIEAVVKTHLKRSSGVVSHDPITVVNAADLKSDFPVLSADHAMALIRLTEPSTTAAHELAKAMTTRSAYSGGIHIIPNYQPLNLEDGEDLGSSSRLTSVPGAFHCDATASSRAIAHAAARTLALSQAHAAHRRAKSDRLMGGAAAYYGQVSRDNAALSRRAQVAAMDQLAASQSSASELDLHGIDVLNGMRIAQERVQRWWSSLGESRVNGRVGADERGAGFRIVVGRGTHSEGGKGKLGPAVGKMLREDGWRFVSEGAVIVVKGQGRT